MDGNTDNATDFPDGSISRIEFRDFLTYENTSLTAGRNLNLIIGVNGSGKSTVICGICLAVGGNPKNLGRSESIGDFVRHGKDLATVELSIVDSRKGTQKLKVIINKEKQHCDYYINNQKTTQKNIKEIAAEYNIQIDNPCTFLAQDKVKSFSEQNPVELLRNTEKAGDYNLLIAHDKLIESRKDNQIINNKKVDAQKKIAVIKGEMEGLKTRVDNYYKQQQQDSKINALVQKQKVVEFDDVYVNYKENTMQLKTITAKWDKKRKELENIRNKRDSLNDLYRKNTDDCGEMRGQYNQLLAKVKDAARPDIYDRMIALHKTEYNEAKRRYEDYEINLKAIRDKKRDLEKTLEKVGNDKAQCQHDTIFLNTERRRILEEKNAIEDEISQTRGTLDQIFHKRRQLQYSFNDKSPYEQKLNILGGERLGPECAIALHCWSWLENNEPNMAVNVPFFELVVRKEDAGYIESLVGVRDLLIFIFQNKEDERRIGQKFPKINTTVIDSKKINDAEINSRLPSKLKEMGFEKFAIEMIQGPDVVLQYLCNVSGLNRIPFAKELLGRHHEMSRLLVDSFHISRYFTPEQLTDIRVSKYSGEMISNNRPINQPKFLLVHDKPVDPGSGVEAQKRQLDIKEKEIRERIVQQESRKSALQLKRQEVEDKMLGLKQLKNKEEVLMAQLDQTNKKLRQEENSVPDLTKAKAAFDAQKKETAVKTLEKAADVTKQLASFYCVPYYFFFKDILVLLYTKLQVNSAVTDSLNGEKVELTDAYDKESDNETRLRTDKDGLNVICTDMGNKLKGLSNDLSRCCDIPTTDESKMSPNQKESWKKIIEKFSQHGLNDKSKDEIEQMLALENANKKMRARDGKQEDVARYRELADEHQELIELAASTDERLQTSTEILKKKIDAWREPVEKLIAAINVNYSKFFQELGCVGEVLLEEPSDPLNIAEYGIMIMVSFRASEPVRRLDHQVQSGGERSVSTMLYLLALQELCPVPFRCVDEINQGMDPTNERKVFDIMINKLTGCGNLAKTQYFLLTPKLLHGLTYNDKVTIQCVYNSRALYPTANQWDPRSFLEKMRFDR